MGGCVEDVWILAVDADVWFDALRDSDLVLFAPLSGTIGDAAVSVSLVPVWLVDDGFGLEVWLTIG